MSTPKENLLRAMRNEAPRWFGDPWSCFNTTPDGKPFIIDPVTLYIGKPVKGETGFVDKWGVTWDFPRDQPGPTPNITMSNKALKDITHWCEEVKFPSLKEVNWDAYPDVLESLDRETRLVMFCNPTGLFEFCHALMGFEDTLVNFLLEPDSMADLLSAYADWKIEAVKIIIDTAKPDFIINFDDWGSKHKLFLSPDIWRAIIKPAYEKFYSYIKSRGVMIMHHCDCYAQDLALDMVDLGIDIWQGSTPENDIREVLERTDGKLFLLGGIDMSVIDFNDAPEALIRGHIRKVYNDYAALGNFMPGYTSTRPVYDRVFHIASDEMDRYGAEFMKNYT